MDWGPHIKALSGWQSKGTSIPALDRKPTIDITDQVLLDGFNLLAGGEHFSVVDAVATAELLGYPDVEMFVIIQKSLHGKIIAKHMKKAEDARKESEVKNAMSSSSPSKAPPTHTPFKLGQKFTP